MLDRWAKIAAIAAAAVIVASAIIGPSIGGIYWLARLDSDVGRLQQDVQQMQADIGQLQSDVEQLQEGQRAILDILERLADDIPEIRANVAGHTHDSDGRARFSLDR